MISFTLLIRVISDTNISIFEDKSDIDILESLLIHRNKQLICLKSKTDQEISFRQKK